MSCARDLDMEDVEAGEAVVCDRCEEIVEHEHSYGVECPDADIGEDVFVWYCADCWNELYNPNYAYEVA